MRGFSAKLSCAVLVYMKQWRNSQKLTIFESEKPRKRFWIKLRFQGCNCKSDIAIFVGPNFNLME